MGHLKRYGVQEMVRVSISLDRSLVNGQPVLGRLLSRESSIELTCAIIADR